MKRTVPLGVCIIILIAAIALSGFGSIMAYKVMTPQAATLTSTSQSSEPSQSGSTDKSDKLLKQLNEIRTLFDRYYVGEIDDETLLDYTMAGFVAGTGDKYGGYYNSEDYKELIADMEGEMQGIGVSVIYNADMGAIEIIDVFPDSPAIKAGLQVGDLIVSCGEENESVASLGYEAALGKLRGLAGTIAKFTILRGENHEEQLDFEIERDYVKEQSVEHRIYEGDKTIGIIKISSFNDATVDQFEDAIEILRSHGVKKLVFDVRNNPGGGLTSICKILDMLLPEGPVIRTKDKSGEEKVEYLSDEKEIKMPMAVIVNSYTASAAELFTSALKDYDKAVIVGEKTYGKGCMQTMYPLSNGGCLKLTSALYYPPYSDNYDGIGITPDVECELSEEAAAINIYKLTDDMDDQLKAAVKALAD